jgi:hypothetical protein
VAIGQSRLKDLRTIPPLAYVLRIVTIIPPCGALGSCLDLIRLCRGPQSRGKSTRPLPGIPILKVALPVDPSLGLVVSVGAVVRNLKEQ